MRIESIHIRNYRVFRDALFRDLTPLTVVVGPNGSGKSTLFDLISFLKESLSENVAAAVARRGGFRELRSRDADGPISITLKCREPDGPRVTYELKVGLKDNKAVVTKEVLMFRRGQYGRPWRFVDFSSGKGIAITNETAYAPNAEQERREYQLDEPSILAIKGLGQFQGFPTVAAFRSLIENWYVSDFHVEGARPSADAGYSEHLSPRGENLALVARYLYEHHPDRFEQVVKAMRRRVPGVQNVEARTTEDGRLVLRFQDGGFSDPFISRYVSDGTVKMFAYLVLLYDPKPHPLLAVEEPENQLYPHVLWELAEEFRGYAKRGGQAFVSTHSPDFLDGVQLEDIFCLAKEAGFTKVTRPHDHDTLRNLVNGGDPPGRLWRQGVLEGMA